MIFGFGPSPWAEQSRGQYTRTKSLWHGAARHGTTRHGDPLICLLQRAGAPIWFCRRSLLCARSSVLAPGIDDKGGAAITKMPCVLQHARKCLECARLAPNPVLAVDDAGLAKRVRGGTGEEEEMQTPSQVANKPRSAEMRSPLRRSQLCTQPFEARGKWNWSSDRWAHSARRIARLWASQTKRLLTLCNAIWFL